MKLQDIGTPKCQRRNPAPKLGKTELTKGMKFKRAKTGREGKQE